MTETPQEPKPGTALTVAERAAVAIGTADRETTLKSLAEAAKTINAITNDDGYKEANAQRLLLKNTRLSITNASKTAREDATAFSKACIAEEKRLVSMIEPQEDRIEKLQKVWDDKIETERQRQIEEENARIKRIQDAIEAIRQYTVDAHGKPSAAVRQFIESCEAVVIDEATFAEHRALADMAKADALFSLKGILEKSIADEAEAEQIRKDREELERLRAEKREADEKKAKEEQARIANEQALARQAQEKEDAKLRERQAEERNAKLKQESDLLNQELERLRLANETRIAAEAPAVELVEQAEEAANDDLVAPTADEIIEAVADHFDVSHAIATQWITMYFTPSPSAALAA